MYVAIEGVIGVGKTTLARFVHAAFSADLLLEVSRRIRSSPIFIAIAAVTLSRRKFSSCSAATSSSIRSSPKLWPPTT